MSSTHFLARLAVCRPVLNQYVHTREEFQTYSTELFKLVKDGHLKLAVHAEYPFTADGVKQAQKDISEFVVCFLQLMRFAAWVVKPSARTASLS